MHSTTHVVHVPAKRGDNIESVRESYTAMLRALGSLHAAGLSHGHLCPDSFRWTDKGVSIVSHDGAPLVSASEEGEWAVLMTQTSLPDPVQVESSRAPRRMEAALWYRPPEVLVQGVAEVLRCKEGSSSAQAVDMWSMGVILAEMITGSPLFGSAETTFDLLSLHCDCLGYSFCSDDLEVISPYDADGNGMDASSRPSLRTLIDEKDFCEHLFDFLSQLLSCDWKIRPSALHALDHPFLWQCSCDSSRAWMRQERRERVDRTEDFVLDCGEDGFVWDDYPALSSPSFHHSAPVGPYPSLLQGCKDIDGELLRSPLPSELQVLVAERRRKRGADSTCPAMGPGSIAKKRRLLDHAPAPIPCGPPFDPESPSC